MISITIDSRKATQYLSNLSRNIPKATNRGMNKFAEGLANKLKIEAKKREHYNTGYLSGAGIHSEQLGEGTWVIKSPYYLKYLELGTAPHFIPRTRATELWASRHKMSFGTFKWIVANYGTRPHPFTNYVLKRELKRLREKTVDKEIKKEIKNSKR